MLPYLISGLTTGSIFALAALGLVLTYKTSGIFNFAHGALASVSAFMFYFLNVQEHVPWPAAATACILGAGPVLGLVLELISRKAQRRPLIYRVLATVGLLLAIQGAIDLIYAPGVQRSVPQFLPQSTVDVLGTPVTIYRIIIVGLALAAVVGLTLFLRNSRAGLAMRAVVDDPDLLDLTGTSPTAIRRTAWIVGTCTASASGVLLVPLLQLDSATFTLLIVTAFGAAAVGAFNSLPLVYAGGLGIGVAQALLQKWFLNSSSLAGGLAPALPFLVLFVLLLVAPRLRRPGPGPAAPQAGSRPPGPGGKVNAVAAVAAAAALAAVPAFAGAHIIDWTRFLAYVLVFLSLGLLVRTSGQVSLAHVSFMVIGVAGFAHLAAGDHLPWLVTVLAAGCVAAPVGALLAIPAIRFPGLYLALATFGFGLLLQGMFYGQPYMFGSLGFGLTVARPGGALSGDQAFYYVVLGIAAAAVLLVFAIEHGRLGRLLRAMSDSTPGLVASGASVNVTKVLVFCISASLAAVGGVLDAAAQGYVGPGSYPPLASLPLFALAVISVGRLPWYALAAAAGEVLVPAYSPNAATATNILTVVFGVAAVVTATAPAWPRPSLFRSRPGTAAVVREARPTEREKAPAWPGSADSGVSGWTLDLREVTVRYGGLVAVDGISLNAPAGRITGLIGPNGAGKTTVFNACTGSARLTSGQVSLGGRRLNRLGAPTRARLGLGRTFQRVELFESLTVAENVAMGREARYAAWNPLGHLAASRRQRTDVRHRADAAMQACGLTGLAATTVAELSTGQKRLVELARCLAGDFRMLLLDEPSSGLDRQETEDFGRILTDVARDRGIGVLIVEHDISLINRLCDHVYVIDFGKPIFDGSVAEAGAAPAVRQAYLGEAPDAAPQPAISDANGTSK